VSKRLISYTESSDRTVTLNFADGTSVQADIVVGADGVHSSVRANMAIAMASVVSKDTVTAFEDNGAKEIVPYVYDGRVIEEPMEMLIPGPEMMNYKGAIWSGFYVYRTVALRSMIGEHNVFSAAISVRIFSL
jgi:2-polyprenyl-6-methoxyphenol hydroxylase-like FAD-dependent oxidoreductase